MSLQLDILTTIIDIHMPSGAVAAVGIEVADVEGEVGRIYSGRSTSPRQWSTVFSGITAFRSSSYALVDETPVFVMGGASASAVEIHYSHDARTWTPGLVAPYASVGSYGVTGIVWDPDARAFFAASGAQIAGDAIFAQRQLWESSDGEAWSLVTELTAFSFEEIEEIETEITAMLVAHCTKPANRGDVPDGYQGHDPVKDIFMKPAALNGWVLGGPSIGLGGVIEIERGEDAPAGIPSSASLPVDIVYGVTFAGGVWHALGVRQWTVATFHKPAVVFVSTNDGRTWVEVFQNPGWTPAGIVSGAMHNIPGA